MDISNVLIGKIWKGLALTTNRKMAYTLSYAMYMTHLDIYHVICNVHDPFNSLDKYKCHLPIGDDNKSNVMSDLIYCEINCKIYCVCSIYWSNNTTKYSAKENQKERYLSQRVNFVLEGHFGLVKGKKYFSTGWYWCIVLGLLLLIYLYIYIYIYIYKLQRSIYRYYASVESYQ